MKASILDLRYKMKEILQALDRNESVTLTYRGIEKGIIVPIQKQRKQKQSAAEHCAFGIWKNHSDKADVDRYIRNLRKGRFDDF